MHIIPILTHPSYHTHHITPIPTPITPILTPILITSNLPPHTHTIHIQSVGVPDKYVNTPPTHTQSVGDPDNYVKLKLDGFMAKPYLIKVAALLNSAFEDILFLDADNVATRDPTYLFDTQEYKDTGAMFFRT